MEYKATVVLEKGYLEKSNSRAADSAAEPSRSRAETISTRVISRELIADGVAFQWWAVGEAPSLVTVKSSIFGSQAEFTHGDPERFAMQLADGILAKHHNGMQSPPLRGTHREQPERGSTSDPLKMPGWFDKR